MEYRKLKELATISISNVDKKTAENEKTVRLCNFVDVYRNWAITENMIPNFMIASAKENEIEKYALHKGDVCITKDSETKDDIGMSTYIADDIDGLVLGYHCALISPDKSVLDGKYLNAFLQTDFVRKFYELNASGSGQRYTLSLDAIGEIPIPVISLEEQKRKGELLSLIDRKIENNNKINDNLHHAASDIFDYYFLQYDFPDHTGNPYRSNNGSFVYCETLKREIPSGFKVCCVDDFCNIFTGKKDVNQSFDSGKYRFYSCAPSYKYSNDKLYEGPAILISGNGSYTGRTIYVDTAFDLYQRTYACTNKDNTDRDMLIYLYYSLLRFLVPQISGGTHGSAIPYIVRDDIAKLPILYNNEAVSLFIKRVKPLLADITRIEEENITLTKLRNNLLPLLMSGQATIAD